jgi:hypothetical protein
LRRFWGLFPVLICYIAYFLDDRASFSYILCMKRMKYKIRFIYEIPDDFKPQGALEDCFSYYLNFVEDFELLVRLGYVMVESSESCKWLKSKTSLAEYLYWANGEDDDEIKNPMCPAVSGPLLKKLLG